MRNGNYAVHRSVEYEITKLNAEEYKLRSYDSGSVREGFTLHPSGCYVKYVPSSGISSAYQVNTWAKYKGLEFPVFDEEEGRLLLGSGKHGSNIIQSFGFTEVDRFEYEKWVDKQEIDDYYEVKRALWGFPATSSNNRIL